MTTKLVAYTKLMRLHKPIGIFLLLWPTLWALWIAGEGLPTVKILVVFLLGVILMRSAGCIINDIADRNFDGRVERTKQRPLVTGTVQLKEAIILFLVLCLLAFLLVLQLNTLTVMLSFVALILASLYPFSKRITHFPQVILGAAFGWSVPMVFAAQTGSIPAIAWLIYLMAIIWPVAYDSIYALSDKADDLKIGLKSTVIIFGKFDVVIIFLLQAAVILSLILLGYFLHLTSAYYLSVILSSLLLVYQFYLVVNQQYQRAFLNNNWIGFLIFIGILLSYWH